MKAEKSADLSHYKFYQKLSALRKKNTFVYGDVNAKAINKNVFAFTRELSGDDNYVVLSNIGANTETVNLKSVFPALGNKLKLVESSSKSDYRPG